MNATCLVDKVDEGEAAALPGFAVERHVNARDGPERPEQLLQILLARVPAAGSFITTQPTITR